MAGTLEEGNGFTKQGLFDNKKETGAWTKDMSGDNVLSESNPAWFSFKLTKSGVMTTYSMVSVNNTAMGDAAKNKTRDPKDWKFYGSKTGADGSWVELDAQTNQEFKERGEQKVYTFENTESYSYYKLAVTQNWGQNGAGNNQRTGLADFRVGLGKDIDLVAQAGLYWNAGSEWGAAATEAQKAETMAACSTEYNRQLDLYNFCVGTSGRVHNQGSTTGLQCESALSDNATSPWGSDRKWAQISMPFSGMAFTVKGYMAQKQPTADSGAALGNQVALKDADGAVRYYQTFRNQTWVIKADGSEGKPTVQNTGVGTGAANAALKAAMEYAYAESAWNLMTPGYNDNKGVEVEDAVTYQAFRGYDSTGKEGDTEGVSYIAGLTSGAAGAFVISDEIFNAWQKTWADGKKFAASGAPVSAAAVDADGNLRQSFEKMIFVQDKTSGEVKSFPNEATISNFSLGGDVEIVKSKSIKLSSTENQVVYIVKDGTDVTKLAPTFVCAGQVTPASGTVTDFTGSFEAPVAYVASGEGGQADILKVSVLTESQADAADEQVLLFKSRLDLLPDVNQVSKTDRSLIVLAKAAYAAMTEMQKFLLGDEYAEKLAAAEAALLKEEKDHKLRILCVGSSTCEGVGSSNNNVYSYPAQLQTLLGSGYVVINKGVSGTTVADKGGNPYRKTARYQESLTSNPDLVFMFVGSNDAVYEAWNRTDIDYPEHFRDSYISLMNDYKNLASNPTVVVTYPYRTFGHAEGRDDLVPRVVIPMLDQIAEETGSPVMDLYEPTNFAQLSASYKDLMPDGLHPNDQGYALIAEAAEQYMGAYTEANLTELKAGGAAIELTDGIYEYAVKAAGDAYPAVTAKAADSAAKVTVTPAVKENPVAVVTVSTDKYTASYRVRFVTDEADMAGQELAADIAKLGMVNYNNLDDVKALRARYDALPTEQKAYVLNEYDLKIAELTVGELSVNAEAAKPVVEKIKAIGDYTSPSQTAAVRKARAAYQTLTATQQALVSNIGDLIAAEAKVLEVDPVFCATEQLEKLGAAASYRDAPVVRALESILAAMSETDKAKLDAGLLTKLEAAQKAVEKSGDNFNVTISGSNWSTDRYTVTPWMHSATAAERTATTEAMADELKYEYVENGYALGKTSGSYDIDRDWGNMLLIQIDNGSNPDCDNVRNPWNQDKRYWSMLTAPFVGMSFSQKGYFATGNTGEPLLGNAFSYQGKVYQVYWGGVRSHDDVALVKDKDVEISSIRNFPGSNDRNADLTNNTFRYAYASYSQANKWENKTLGIPAGYTVSDPASGVLYQAFEGPDGTAYIAGAADTVKAADANGGKPEGAYAIPAAVAAALSKEAASAEAIFAKMGAPVSNAVTENGETIQQFAKYVITVKADGSYTLADASLLTSLQEAQQAAQTAVDDMAVTNAATEADILAVVKNAVDNADIEAAISGFTKTEATAEAAGSITATVTLTLGDFSLDVEVDLTIPKLSAPIIKGDLNGDGSVNVTDVMAACRVLARKAMKEDPTADEMARGDVNGDGYFTITDVMAICKILADKN